MENNVFFPLCSVIQILLPLNCREPYGFGGEYGGGIEILKTQFRSDSQEPDVGPYNWHFD